jgi:hypothetical protein
MIKQSSLLSIATVIAAFMCHKSFSLDPGPARCYAYNRINQFSHSPAWCYKDGKMVKFQPRSAGAVRNGQGQTNRRLPAKGDGEGAVPEPDPRG